MPSNVGSPNNLSTPGLLRRFPFAWVRPCRRRRAHNRLRPDNDLTLQTSLATKSATTEESSRTVTRVLDDPSWKGPLRSPCGRGRRRSSLGKRPQVLFSSTKAPEKTGSTSASPSFTIDRRESQINQPCSPGFRQEPFLESAPTRLHTELLASLSVPSSVPLVPGLRRPLSPSLSARETLRPTPDPVVPSHSVRVESSGDRVLLHTLPVRRHPGGPSSSSFG